MRIKLIGKAALLALIAVLGVLGTASTAGAVEQVQDGGFEATTCPGDGISCADEPFWIESGTQAFLCQFNYCPSANPAAATGSAWAVLGSHALVPTVSEQGAITQWVEIPSSPAILNFKLRIVNLGGPGTAYVYVDGEVVFALGGIVPGYSAYRLESIDVSAFAGPGVHKLQFAVDCTAVDPDLKCQRFDFDDVSLKSADLPAAPPVASPTGSTGQRVAALRKCKKKRSQKARKKCSKRARRLPV